MDNFRWILLAVGIVIIVVIYLISRKNKREFYQYDDDVSDDLPDIKPVNWDDLDEGVGEVRIVARTDDAALDESEQAASSYGDSSSPAEGQTPVEDEDIPVIEDVVERAPREEPKPDFAPAPAEAPAEPVDETDRQEQAEEVSEAVLVLNILARDGSTLSGKSINSVAHANNMVFGDMNIYHRLDSSKQPVFSMINMVKPGSFDPATIHELATPGVSLFLQLPGPDRAADAFDDMLQTAHRIAETLEARLCDQRRQPLTESVVEQYRTTASSFDGKN